MILILPGVWVAGSVRVRGSPPIVVLPGVWVAGSVQVRGSPPMIRPSAGVAGSWVSPSSWVFGCAGFYVHVWRDRLCLDGRSAVSQMGE
jgi:hypothetical protein